MQDELSFLIKLQQFDAAVDILNEKAEEITPQIAAKNKQLDSLKNDLKSSKDALSQHQVRKKQLEMDAEAQEKLVQKHNSELNSLKSNDAYKAMLGEIKAAKDKVVKIEDEILQLMEAVETDDKKYKELEKKFRSDEGAVKSEIQNLESQKNSIIEDAKKKKAERDEFSKSVPAPLLSQYEAIREKRGGLAIVPMLNNSCSGCRMQLTPAKANEVKKAKSMVLCDSCSRILYLLVEQPAESSSAAAPAS